MDAAVAALFCNGVVNMQSMGIGGGFTMTIYNRAAKSAYVLDARETAPSSATKNMYPLNSELSENGRFSKNKIMTFKEKSLLCILRIYSNLIKITNFTDFVNILKAEINSQNLTKVNLQGRSYIKNNHEKWDTLSRTYYIIFNLTTSVALDLIDDIYLNKQVKQ